MTSIRYTAEQRDAIIAAHPGIDPDQWWYWTPEWQAAEREADEDTAAGRGHYFSSGADLLEWLRADENADE